jgi:hypothetical protein
MEQALDSSPDIDLDVMIDMALPALRRGRRGAVAPAPSFVREIVAEDFPRILQGAVEKAPGATNLQRLRTTHHLAARCLAEGKSVTDTAVITGYSVGRIYQFQQDPTFQELYSYYKDQVREKWLNVQERLAALSLDMTEEIQRRLDEVPDSFTNEELRRWVETLADRSGNGPSSSRNVTVRGGMAIAHLIEQVKRESEETSQVKLLQAAE